MVKGDRKYFRRKFGVQFLLDVIRSQYCDNEHLNPEDSKTIRVALFGLIKFYLQREVSAKEALPLGELNTFKEVFILGLQNKNFITLEFRIRTIGDKSFNI